MTDTKKQRNGLMSRRSFALVAIGVCTAYISGCSHETLGTQDTSPSSAGEQKQKTTESAHLAGYVKSVDGYTFLQGKRIDRGFEVDDQLQTPDGRTLHFSLHIPDSYDGEVSMPLYVACPGWEGLYFQGIGANLQEDYPFVANDYIPDLIVASPQLDDWNEQSASDTIELTEWLLKALEINASRIYLSGCSGGGETISLVLGQKPALFHRALHVISRWDGNIDVLTQARVPVCMAIGQDDDYYGSKPAEEAYERIVSAYEHQGLTQGEIDELIQLDVKPSSYFESRGWPASRGQHGGGGYLFAHDEAIMRWFFEV